jgi:hypothetical protein
MWRSYLRQLEKHPLAVKSTSALFIFSFGDIGTQYVTHRFAEDELRSDEDSSSNTIISNKDLSLALAPSWLDLDRTRSLAMFGVCATTCIHFWWGVLEPFVAKIFDPVKEKGKNVALKVLLDQSIGAGMYNAIFFGVTSAMEGKSPQECVDIIEKRWFTQMKTHWMFWPAFHSINFYVLPLNQRVLAQNFASIGWSAVLSKIKAEQQKESLAEGSEEAAAAAAPIQVMKTSLNPELVSFRDLSKNNGIPGEGSE